MVRLVLTGFVLLVVGAATLAQDAAAKDKEKLQGLWQAVHLEVQGKKATDDDIKKFRVLIKGDKIVFGPGEDDRLSTFFLIPTKTPKAIDLIPASGPAKDKRLPAGIYSVEGDELKICLDKEGEGKGRPKEFKTMAGDGYALLVFKRVKK